MKQLLREFIRHVAPHIIKPLRIVWNQIIGFLFLTFAIVPIPRTVRAWKEFTESGDGLFRVVVSAIFILMMASFGIHSFLRARKISRS
jgi:hypothetical protein